MAKKVIPISAAARKAAAKPAALTPQQKANANAVAALAKSLGVKAEIEGVDEEEVEAVATATVLADGAGTLYTDGELAEGSEVFNDEAMTTATADGTYESEDGRDIVVAGGVVESVTEVEASTEEETETPTVAALRKQVETLSAQVEKFSKAVPPTPKAKGSSQVPDAKTPAPKAKGILKGASAQK